MMMMVIVNFKFTMTKVTDAIYELMGQTSSTAKSNVDAHAHVEKIFQTMDLNHDGLISVDEFIQYCTSQQDVRNSLAVSKLLFWLLSECLARQMLLYSSSYVVHLY